MHRSNGPNTGSNPRGGGIGKKLSFSPALQPLWDFDQLFSWLHVTPEKREILVLKRGLFRETYSLKLIIWFKNQQYFLSKLNFQKDGGGEG